MTFDPQNKFVLGLTGSVGSGCTTLSEVLEDCGFCRVSLSTLIKKKFREIHGKEPTRESFGSNWRYELQNIGNRGRRGEFENSSLQQDAKGYWVHATLDGVDPDRGNIVIDGIRNMGEVRILREMIPWFRLLAVHADYETRWKRIQHANSYDSEQCFGRDDLRDSGEDDPTGQDVRHCVYTADYIFRNEETLSPASYREAILKKKIGDELNVLRGKDAVRDPTKPEVFMATAVTQSNASRCLKRKVGI